MIKLQLNKEVATKALNAYIAQLRRKRDKETNLMIVELLDADINIVQNGINTITDSK